MIEVGVAGRLWWALVDSGADFSMINDVLYHEIKESTKVTMQPPTRTAVGVGGERVPILGELQGLTLRVQHKQLACPAVSVVAGLVHDIVLGRDFCCKMGTVLDDRRGTLQVGDLTITLPTYEEIRPQRSRVRVAAAVVIPPRSGVTIWAKLQPVDGRLLENDPHPLEGVLEPSGKLGHEELLVPRIAATMSRDGTVPVRITNVTAEEATILEGSDIGTFFTITNKEQAEYQLCEEGKDKPDRANLETVPGLDLSCPDLSEVGRQKLEDLTKRFRDIFSSHPDDIGTTHLLQHPIDTGDAPPVKQQPRRIPQRLREQVEVQKENMLANGVIEESTSPWCSPVVLARKRDGSVRFCVDLRAVNSVTKPIAYPLPRIDEALDSLSGAKFFTTLDMTAGYWQVDIAPEDREKTAFSTGKGLHHFRKMAMGLRNAGATFQKLMELVLAGVDAQSCLVYLDDVILFNKTEDGHIRTLEEVFTRIRRAGLKLKPQKCLIGKKEVTFLGHQVSREGIRPDPSNIEKVLSWPRPNNDAEAKSFLGLCGYYAKFIPDYAEVIKPLREASNRKGTIDWTTDLTTSFNMLKKSLASPPVLTLPSFNGTFRLYTDACNSSVGAVLTEAAEGEEKVVAYESKVLSRQQRRWPTYDKELWAVVHAIRRFHQYVTGARFQVITDHKPLANIPKSIASERDGTGRRGRWAIELSSYDFDVIIKAGAEHMNADALSRRPEPGSDAEREGQREREVAPRGCRGGAPCTAAPPAVSPAVDLGHPQDLSQVRATESGTGPTEVHPVRVSTAQQTDIPERQARTTQQPGMTSARQGTNGTAAEPDEQHRLLSAQREDPVFRRLKELAGNTGNPPTRQQLRDQAGEWSYLGSRWTEVTEENGLLGLRGKQPDEPFRVLVPEKLREDVLKWSHEHPSSGHMCTQKTVNRLLGRFSWPGMCHQANMFCRSCVLCQRRSRPTPSRRAPLITETASHPFERVALDITEMPLSSDGNKYALVVMDYFSKYVRIYPMKNQKAVTVSECLMDWVYELGVPERIHSDQGPQFESIVFQELCKQLGIRKTRTTPYHPQSDGMVERFMRTLKDMVAKYVDAQGLTWDKGVKAYAMAYNSAVHNTTGYSPFFLVHGYEPRLPMDVQFATPRPLVDVQSFPEERRRGLEKAFEDVRRASKRAASESAKRYDKATRHIAYQEGDKVWIRDHTAAVGGKPKLGLPYKGPGTVIRAVGERGKEVTYAVRLPGSKDRIVHHNDLKPLIQWGETRRSPQNDGEEGMPHLARSAHQQISNGGRDARPQDEERASAKIRVWNGSQTMPPRPPSSLHDQMMTNPPDTEHPVSDNPDNQQTNHAEDGNSVDEQLGETEAGASAPLPGAINDTLHANGQDNINETETGPQTEQGGADADDTPYDESLLTPYITKAGRRSIPVMKYQAGVSPTVAELKHKYELFLNRK